jgi:hydroxyacylglutathione hydrolase
MKVKSIILNPFLMNCYIYYDDVNWEGIIIDPAVSNENEQLQVKDFIESNQLKIVYIINTHGHIDHIMGNKWAKEYFKVPIIINEDDLYLLESASTQGNLFGLTVPVLPKPDKFVSDGDLVSFNNCTLNILRTPGHSPGSICLVDAVNKNIFTGDCIFKNSIGRTDLQGGDLNILLNSINDKIFAYQDDFKIFPGHMEQSTIGEEKKNNPFLNGEYPM